MLTGRHILLSSNLSVWQHKAKHLSTNQWCREELEYLANTLIFVLAGVIIAGNIYVNSTTDTDHISGVDYVYALLLWVYLLVRCCTVAALTSSSLAGFLLGS